MRTLIAAALIAWSLTPDVSHAACAKPYPSDQLVNDLQVLQMALRNLDDATFSSAGKRLDAGIGCLENAAPPVVYASAYRYLGTWHFLVLANEAQARRWFRTSLEVDPTYSWDANELELEHPLRAMWEQERLASGGNPVAIPGKTLVAPEGTTLLLDGRPIPTTGGRTAAAATPGRPHLLQAVVTGSREIRASWTVDGNTFPVELLAAEVAAVVPEAEPEKPTKKAAREQALAPSSVVDETGMGTVTAQRVRPKEKTPLIIAGIAGVVAAGGVYGASLMSRGSFDDATTTEDVESLQTQTNALVLASGGVLLVGLGVGYWGIILEGGAGVGFGGHF